MSDNRNSSNFCTGVIVQTKHYSAQHRAMHKLEWSCIVGLIDSSSCGLTLEPFSFVPLAYLCRFQTKSCNIQVSRYESPTTALWVIMT